MSSLLKQMAPRRKSKKDRSEKAAKSNERRSLVKELAQGDAGRTMGLLDGYSGGDAVGSTHSDDYGGAYEDEEMRAPIFSKKKGAANSGKRTHYGSQQTSTSGATNLGLAISTFTSYVKHTVDPDDTFPRLSLTYSISVADIKRANKMYDTDPLFSRAELIIPINDTNRAVVSADQIITSGHPSTAPHEKEETDPVDEPSRGDADAVNEPSSAEIPASPSAKSAAKDFFAKFDSNFKQTKASVAEHHEKSAQSPTRSPNKAVWSKGPTPQMQDNRIGSGIRGDTSHISYQN
eukprot:m.682840 g.682840  ORF g.682840 m.682840 type:complete len:291 (+) comp22823_c2_seq1:226-1098(+)